ncbi:MAG: MFS transporter [Gemmatimonadales bacterium]
MLGLLAVAELLGMSPWFAASAAAPELRSLWGLTAGQAAWLTSAVQLGFVAGTLAAAVLNLADLWPGRRYFAGAALLAAAANLALLAVDGFGAALALRCLTGFALAGVYPPAMKMAATWFQAERGLAIGAVVGALTVGKATPFLVEAMGGARLEPILLSTSAGAAVAALLVAAAYRDGPFAFPSRPFDWRLAGTVARLPELRLVTGGYLGHMWELYSYWAWIAAFLAASVAARGAATETGGLAFVAIAIGAVGCVWAGRVADRIGRERVVTWSLATSGTCALLVGFAFGRSLWILLPIVLVWGVAVIADSAQFSALVTEVAPAHAVGTALTLQTSLGFLLTLVTIQLVPPVVELVGWRWAFGMLAAGPVVGIACIGRLARRRSSSTAAR